MEYCSNFPKLSRCEAAADLAPVLVDKAAVSYCAKMSPSTYR